MADFDEATAAFEAYVPLARPLAVALPRNPLMRFSPTVAPVFDQGNGNLFHTSFLTQGGVRSQLAIPGGRIVLRPAHMVVKIDRVSRATRTELGQYLKGRFPMGAKIDGAFYSSASLVQKVLSSLPGTVTISY